MNMAVGVISWNTRDLLRTCLASVLREEPAEVVVVDNGSMDGSPMMVRREFPGVRVVVNPDNPGFGAAGNQAFALTSSSYLLVLNGDTQLLPGSLDTMTRYLDQHPRVGVVGPKLVHPDGRLQSSCSAFPSPCLPLVKSKGLTRWLQRIPVVRDRVMDTWAHDRTRQVPWVVGAALAIRREAFQAVGGFDQGFHLYFEEPDLCRRMLMAGWTTHFFPEAQVIHVEGASTGQHPTTSLSAWAVSYWRYNEKHFTGTRLALARLTYRLGMRVRWYRERLRIARATDGAARAKHLADAEVWSRAISQQPEQRV